MINALPGLPAPSALPATSPTAAEATALPADGLALFQALLGSGLPASGAELKAAAVPAKPEALEPDADAEGAVAQADALAALWLQWLRPMPAASASPAPPDVAAGAEAAPSAPDKAAVAKALSLPVVVETLQPTDLIEQATPSEGALLPEVPVLASIERESAAEIRDVPLPLLPAPAAEQGRNTFASMLPAMPGSAAPAAAPAPPPPGALDTRQADWTQALGEHIAWSLDAQQDAVIELHPAELGSLNVRVEMRGNDAQVTIVAGTPAARELLQQSLPQLRELLSVQGLNLARAQIERPAGAGFGQSNQTGSDGRERGMPSRGRRALTGLLLVDSYA